MVPVLLADAALAFTVGRTGDVVPTVPSWSHLSLQLLSHRQW
jgi:hypothetical protein